VCVNFSITAVFAQTGKEKKRKKEDRDRKGKRASHTASQPGSVAIQEGVPHTVHPSSKLGLGLEAAVPPSPASDL
jgi:hypothetical protein